MIRCSHCGKLAPTGALSCQHCGMPLVSSGAGVAGAGQSEQQELPAWLESLRGAHERPVPSGQESRQPFSLDELVDEDSMPSWMRQDGHKLPESGNSDSLPAIPAVPKGTPSDSASISPAGFQAGSLIDERSLPGWMREEQGGASQSSPGVSAPSLVDQQALPSWMKELDKAGQKPPATNPYALPSQPQASEKNTYGLPVQTPITPPSLPSAPNIPQTPPMGEPPAGFSAHDLLDVQAMPGWMSNLQGPGKSQGAPPPTRPMPTGQGFSAGELIDQRSVPTWMRDLQGAEKSDPQSAMGVPVSGSGQIMGTNQGQQGTASNQGMPAGSLGDKNSMPSWMQESQLSSSSMSQPAGQGLNMGSQEKNAMPAWLQESQLSNTPRPSLTQESQLSNTPMPQPASQGFSAGSLIEKSAMPAWMQENGPVAGSSAAPQTPGQGFSAGSLIDKSAMPAWMQESQLGSSAPASPTLSQGFNANSLLENSAAPSWTRANDQGSAQPVQPAGQGFSAGSLIEKSAMPTWMQENQPTQTAGGQGFNAGSLIDKSAMPAWMREAESASGASGMGGRPGQAPARPVPSRPRGEATPLEQSEAAANVFASMLGVAASAPALPGQDALPNTTLGVAQAQPSPSLPPFQQAQQPPIPGWQQPGMNQYNQGAQPQAWQMAGAAPVNSPAPNPYAAPNEGATGVNNWVQRGNTPPQPAWAGQPTADKTTLGVPIGNMADPGKNAPGNAQSADNKKKGLFDTIREFFMH